MRVARSLEENELYQRCAMNGQSASPITTIIRMLPANSRIRSYIHVTFRPSEIFEKS